MLTDKEKQDIISDICSIANNIEGISDPVILVNGQPFDAMTFDATLSDSTIDVGLEDNVWVLKSSDDTEMFIDIFVNIKKTKNAYKVTRENDPDFIEQVEYAIQLGKL